MSRAERLLELMQSLRLRRRPVAGQALAEELGVSLRTLYRDIDALKAQGAGIEGEAGLGYVLKAGFTLPPLMFSLEEVEALALGARWVEGRADPGLAKAARGALAKIAAVLPPERAEALDWPTMLAGAGAAGERGRREPSLIREALRAERKLKLAYVDKDGTLVDAGRLAGCARLFRPCADARRLVRDARRLPPFPPRPDGGGRGPRRAPAEPAPGAAHRLAPRGGARRVSGASACVERRRLASRAAAASYMSRYRHDMGRRRRSPLCRRGSRCN